MLTGVQKMLDAIGGRAGFSPGEIGTNVFRHTFCSAALQTLDNGQPISKYTVQRWMGHGGSTLVDRIYGDLGDIRHRSEHVEFKVEQHTEVLEKRLRALAV